MKKSERIRVNMRLPGDLVSWARKHGDKRKVTFTSLVIAGLEILQYRATKKRSNAR